jgi:hypothetical protein
MILYLLLACNPAEEDGIVLDVLKDVEDENQLKVNV